MKVILTRSTLKKLIQDAIKEESKRTETKPKTENLHRELNSSPGKKNSKL
jgi:hypothetical protein